MRLYTWKLASSAAEDAGFTDFVVMANTVQQARDLAWNELMGGIDEKFPKHIGPKKVMYPIWTSLRTRPRVRIKPTCLYFEE